MTEQNLQRDTLRKLKAQKPNKLIDLRLEYSEKSQLLTSYVNNLVSLDRIYPTHLPTQSSHRWSTIDPPLTNFPRACINPYCKEGEHEWDTECWSVRDIVLPDSGECLVSWDHDNIEGRIHDLYLNDTENLKSHREGYDLHTITCCTMFSMDLPSDLKNPHTSTVDSQWRAKYQWQGKDTQRRVMAKNFNHGSKYTLTPRFVYSIPNIEKYGLARSELLELAKKYMASKKEVIERKKVVMANIKRTHVARNLYGARRLFYDSSEHTAKEGFAFIISSTVSLYNNETLIIMHRKWPAMTLLHNAHDGDKITFPSNEVPSIDELRTVIEREVEWDNRAVKLTAGIKVHK